MRYTIYQITNLINNKIYIGKHQTIDPNDNYFGSGKYIKDAIKKHGRNNFIKTILHDFDTEYEMNLMEKELITEEFVLRKDTYNLGIGGEGGPHFKGRTHTMESIIKARETKKQNGIPVSSVTREKLSKALKHRVISDEHKQKLSEAAKRNASDGIYKGKLIIETRELWRQFESSGYTSIRQFAKSISMSHNALASRFKTYIPEFKPVSNKAYKQNAR
jgi:group I intron endonuclease